MHSKTLVLVPNLDNIEGQVKTLLAPYHDDIQYQLPDSQRAPLSWDWYSIGGRWQGYLAGTENCAECDQNWQHVYSTAHNTPTGNVAQIVPGLREDISGAYILSDKGCWGEEKPWRSDDDWFKRSQEYQHAEPTRTEADWNQKCPEVLSQHRGYYIVCVDTHD